MKLTHLGYVLAATTILLSGNRINDSLQSLDASMAEKAQAGAERAAATDRVAEQIKLSKLAMQRVKGPCLPIVDQATGKPGYIGEGVAVIDAQLNRPVPDGVNVCNELGDTAEVADGVAVNIARIVPEQRAEYLRFYHMQIPTIEEPKP